MTLSCTLGKMNNVTCSIISCDITYQGQAQIVMYTGINCGGEYDLSAVTHQGCQHLAPHGGCPWEGQSDPRWTGMMTPLSSTLLYLVVKCILFQKAQYHISTVVLASII